MAVECVRPATMGAGQDLVAVTMTTLRSAFHFIRSVPGAFLRRRRKCWIYWNGTTNLTCNDNDLKSAEDDINCVTCKRHDRMTAITNDANNVQAAGVRNARQNEKKRTPLTTTLFTIESLFCRCNTAILFHSPSHCLSHAAHFHLLFALRSCR